MNESPMELDRIAKANLEAIKESTRERCSSLTREGTIHELRQIASTCVPDDVVNIRWRETLRRAADLLAEPSGPIVEVDSLLAAERVSAVGQGADFDLNEDDPASACPVVIYRDERGRPCRKRCGKPTRVVHAGAPGIGTARVCPDNHTSDSTIRELTPEEAR